MKASSRPFESLYLDSLGISCKESLLLARPLRFRSLPDLGLNLRVLPLEKSFLSESDSQLGSYTVSKSENSSEASLSKCELSSLGHSLMPSVQDSFFTARLLPCRRRRSEISERVIFPPSAPSPDLIFSSSAAARAIVCTQTQCSGPKAPDVTT